MKFAFQNCSICRLKCVERKEPNIEGLSLSLDTKKYKGQCITRMLVNDYKKIYGKNPSKERNI